MMIIIAEFSGAISHELIRHSVNRKFPREWNGVNILEFHGLYIPFEFGGKNASARLQDTVAEIHYVCNHVFAEKRRAHLLMNNNIHLLRRLEGSAMSGYELDVSNTVLVGSGAGEIDYTPVLQGAKIRAGLLDAAKNARMPDPVPRSTTN